MIFRFLLFVLAILLLASCAQEVSNTDDSQCLTVQGTGSELNNSGYIIDIRNQNDADSIREEYIENYGSGFDVTEISGRRIFANINSSLALDELRCDDSRIEGISYDSPPDNQGGI